MARVVDVVVVGAGHCGLAMSRCLAERGIEHVVLERGEVAHAWRHERWDSLRLLTPSWQCRLPGFRYDGANPDGFMSSRELAEVIERYCAMIGAPVLTGTRVTRIEPAEGGYRVATVRGAWRCRALVLASGANTKPTVPAAGADLPSKITALTPKDYRNPAQLDQRPVLVVGASATGLQLAHEIHLSGRRVILAVGEHVRMPRVYRGFDIQCWMERTGILDERYDEIDDLERARRVPSPQLVGTPERRTLDLNALTDQGVEIVGRLASVTDARAWFSGSLRNHCASADLKLGRLLERIDRWIDEHPDDNPRLGIAPPERHAPTRVPAAPRTWIDLERERIGSVIWATGFRPDYSWLHAPVFDHKGRLRHDGGIVSDGLYVMGLPFMRRRRSSFIHGAEADARELSAHLRGHLERTVPGRARAAVA